MPAERSTDSRGLTHRCTLGKCPRGSRGPGTERRRAASRRWGTPYTGHCPDLLGLNTCVRMKFSDLAHVDTRRRRQAGRQASTHLACRSSWTMAWNASKVAPGIVSCDGCGFQRSTGTKKAEGTARASCTLIRIMAACAGGWANCGATGLGASSGSGSCGNTQIRFAQNRQSQAVPELP